MSWDVPYITKEEDAAFAELKAEDLSEIVIRHARADDVHGMSALINMYAGRNVMLARGPLYLYQHLQDYIVATACLKGSTQEYVVGCGALQILWADLAEIRSLAVHQSCHHNGLGRRIVASLTERCRMLGVPRVFCFTLVDAFFRQCGFTECSREELPAVVWTECSKCPKFYHCDEISMMYMVDLEPKQRGW